MSDLQGAVNTPITMTLADGNEYVFEKITPNIWVEFCVFLNQCAGERINKPVEIEEMLSQAQSVTGIRWLLWRCLKKNHPKVTAQMVGDLVSFAVMADLVRDLMDLPEADEGSDPPAEEETP